MKKGAKSGRLQGKGKKKLITRPFAVSVSGDFLHMKLIGATPGCFPKDVNFPTDFNVTST